MALLDSEIARCKYELGYNLLSINSEPRIDHVAVFEQVIQPYMEAGSSTTSATAVTAASVSTPVAITLTSATGFDAGAVVIVDVDTRQERVTVQSISGSAITVQLKGAHSGTYPVTVEGGEAIVRSILRKLYDLDDRVGSASTSAGIKQLGQGEIEWFGDSDQSVAKQLSSLRMVWRDELSSALFGTTAMNMWRGRKGGGRSALY